MNATAKPVPSKHYRQRQRELHRLLDVPNSAARNGILSITEQLEAEFVHAWGFSDDPSGQGLEMKMMVGRNSGNPNRCLDHCTCYFEPRTGSHIVVTQPYLECGEAVESLTCALTLKDQLKPEIISAPEWAFYYPGYATLIIINFPPGYETILQALDRLWSPAAEWNLHRN